MILIGKFFTLPIIVLGIGFLCVCCINKSAEKSFAKNLPNTPYDAIIVPGVPFKDSAWSTIMKARVYWSRYLYERGYAKNIIYSGAAVYSPYVESKIMKEYGIALGIPPQNIFTDTMAQHSTENLYYSYQIAKNYGFEKVALATDPFQNSFLVRFAKKNDIDVDFLPIIWDTLKEMEQPDPEIDPSGAHVENFVSLPDRKGFFERLKGTMGGRINPTLYQ